MAVGKQMSMPMLPIWLVWVWVAALAVVLLLHLYHAGPMRGHLRLWHISHILMAVGMIVMYAVPQASHANLYWGGVGLYAALTVAMATVGARWWRSERLLNWLWTASTVDLGVMTYMALPAANRTVTISYLAVVYLAVEMVIWLSGPALSLPRAAVDGMAIRARPPRSAATPDEGESACLVADVTIDLRVAMVVMSASMVWMLIAMQNMQPLAGGTMMLIVPVSARVCQRLGFRR